MDQETSLWKNRKFIKFFGANACSNLGNWFDFIAVLILFRYTWKADPLLIALIPVMYAVPSMFLGQLAGVFSDRRNKLILLIYSDWIRAGFTFLLLFMPSPLFSLPVLLLRNTAGVISLPAQQGLMRMVVHEEHLMKAVTMNGSVYQLMKVAGPLAGGSVTGFFSPGFAIGINAVSFVLSGVVLMLIPMTKREKEKRIRKTNDVSFFISWREGWAVVLKSRILLASMIFGVFSTLTIQMIDAQIVTLFSEVFPERAELTGWAVSFIGMGSFLIVMLLNKMNKIEKYGWFFGTGSLLIGLMILGFGLLGEYDLAGAALVLSFIGGVGNGLTFTAVNYMIQKEPPEEVIGRVSGIVDSTLSLLFIVGPLLGGIMIRELSVLQAFKMIGVVLCLLGTAGLVFQKLIWPMDKREETIKEDREAAL
ncbi:MFS transporter [Halobacillus salinarum]|uniref:MFS transporter n=1 Tax=Halobacillus salinarum TaxID=2932257 RepID=A0ABY4EME2_9BACI|nr:MFS transporter [Halobacillus salinarum]UOQ45624.1 MFS transporter [Halobacillus salinarum]